MTPSSSNADAPSARGPLRRTLRARRDALSATERASAARAVASHIARTRWLRAGRPVGLYLSFGSELDTAAVRALARRRQCPVYLPRIISYRRRRMLLVRDQATGRHHHNRFGIPEPSAGTAVALRRLAVVFVPLLGVDARGIRLGYGGGYYDRLLGSGTARGREPRPLRVGLGYSWQLLAHIEADEHDAPLDALVTETGVTYFHHPDSNS